MIQYKIVFEKSAVKFLRSQPLFQQTRLLKAIAKLPYEGDIKKMAGYKGLFRLRVGDYRILYVREEQLKIIDIQDIDSRGQAYKRL